VDAGVVLPAIEAIRLIDAWAALLIRAHIDHAHSHRRA
jgi:hypothetical protein